MMNAPKLRFSKFTGEWKENTLGELLEFKNGINATKEQYGHGVKFINVLDILNNDFITSEKIVGKVAVDDNIIEKYKVSYGDILFQRSSETREEVGTANVYLDKENIATFGGFVIRGKKIGEYVPIFMNKLLKTKSAREEITSKSGGSTRYNVGQDILSNIKLFFPPLPEQEKIADFLSSVDIKIEKLERKKELWEEYKKGMMQKIFSQEIRFKDEKGNEYPQWEEKKLGEIFQRITTKNKENNMNVLTISAQKGLISQIDFFSKSVAGKNLKGYYLLEKGDFAYNKSYSNGYPVGAIKKLKYYTKGIVSSLYICFKSKVNISDIFYEYYFESGVIEQEIKAIAQEGARNHGLLNIGISDFFEQVTILFPFIKEQNKIANFLSSIDSKIEIVEKELEGMKEFKKGLLQGMFV